jgi:hypothetical protein
MRNRPWLWVLVAASLLSLPVLTLGLVNDDFIHRLALSAASEKYNRDALTLYDFLKGGEENAILMDAGLLPWFTDPGLTARFFRPLSSLLLALDVSLFGQNALPAHLHSLAWFALVVVLAWKIHRALLPERVAPWATFVFAIGGAHVETTSWIAARHMLVSGAFGLLAWYSEIRRQELGDRRLALLGSACLVVGLFASEAALCAVPFVLGQAWFGGNGSTKARFSRTLPTLSIGLVYLVAYAVAGYGTKNIGSYVSPLDAPLRFVVTAVGKLPLLATELFTGLPCVLSYADQTVARAFWVTGAIAAALVTTFALRKAATLGPEGRNFAWLPAATLASLVPVCGTIIDGRILGVPMVGSSALVGLLLSRIVPVASSSLLGRSARFAGLGLLFAAHLGLSPLVRVAFALNYRTLGRIQTELPQRAKLDCAERARLLAINGSDPTIGMYGAAAFYYREKLERRGWHVLSMAQNDLELERLSERSFVLRTLGPRRAHFIEEFYRPPDRALHPGDVVRLASMTITVNAVDGKGPTETRFDLDSDPNGVENCLARWVGGAEGRLESVSLPDTGKLRVRYEPGPMGM